MLGLQHDFLAIGLVDGRHAHAGEALAREFENVAPHEPVAPLRAVLGEVGLERVAHKELLDEMRREALVLGRFLKIQ